MVLTYTILVLLSGICVAWAVLSIPRVYRWANSLGPHSLMINVIAGLLLALITGGFAFHAASSGAVTGSPPPTPTPTPSTSPTPASAGVPTTPPASASSPDLPVAFVGTWKGTGHVYSPATDFAVIVTLRPGQLGSSVGTIDRPTLGCFLDLKLDKVTDQSIDLTEVAASDHSWLCDSSGTQVAESSDRMSVSLAGSSLQWKEFYKSTSPTAVATLTKTA
jgi:hypothetical protein